MASMICKKCGNMVNNEELICSNCEFPFYQENNVTQALNTRIASVEKKNKLSRGLLPILIILALIANIYFIYLLFNVWSHVNIFYHFDDYLEDINELNSLMFVGASMSESESDNIIDVWYNSIYKIDDVTTNPYTMAEGTFRDDFNDSLIAYFESNSHESSLKEIEVNKTKVGKILNRIENLNSSSVEIDYINNLIYELHKVYLLTLYNANSPSGTLNSYSQSVTDNSNDYYNINQTLNFLIQEMRD